MQSVRITRGKPGLLAVSGEYCDIDRRQTGGPGFDPDGWRGDPSAYRAGSCSQAPPP